jgi:branched-subunit amino acid transport protein
MSPTIEWSWTVFLALIGLGAVTLLTRSFFLLPEREWPLPHWLRKGLRYAPLAALSAVTAPEIVMTQGHLIDSLADARLYAALAAVGWYAWRRSILGTLAVGMAVLLPLRIGLGW